MSDLPAFSAKRARTLDTASLLACLPSELRATSTTVTRLTTGMSGAGVYRVETTGGLFALKITAATESFDAWRAKTSVQRAAGEAGVAPRVVHTDDARRAVLSEWVADRGLIANYWNPATQAQTIARIGGMLRALHALPVTDAIAPADPLRFLEAIERAAPASAVVPEWVSGALAAVRHEYAAHASPGDSALVMSHNDVNPTNLAFDGTRVMLLDWQTPAPNDRWYDLATAALFLRMDQARSLELLSAYTGTRQPDIPARVTFLRRVAALLSGMASLQVAREGGHPGAAAPALAHETPALADVYTALRNGTLAIGTPDGQWTFGLALIRESIAA